MILNDLILEYDDDKEMLGEVLKLLDITVKYIHSKGYFIRDFDPKRIILVKGIPNLSYFQGLISKIQDDLNREVNVNIYQMAKIGLMAYNHMPLDGNMNQNHFNLIFENLKSFNQNGQIPAEIYEYYEDLFINGNVNYMTNYLKIKNQNEVGRESSIRKKLTTEAGAALETNSLQINSLNEDKAFVNIMFIPSIIALLYLLGLFIYVFFIK